MVDIICSAPQVLLVETNEDEAILFRRIFSGVARHWQVVWEKNGPSAMHRILYHGFPDLLVTRLEMPRLSGIDLVECIRSLKSPKFVPVLVYDRLPTTQQREQLKAWGVEEYLDKHSPPEKFKTLLRRIIAKLEQEVLRPGTKTVGGRDSSSPGFDRSDAN